MDFCQSLAWTSPSRCSISRSGTNLSYDLYSSPEPLFGLTLTGLGLVDTP